MRPLILDIQSTARGFDDAAQVTVERALAETDARLDVCPAALAIATHGPLDSFNALTYRACSVKWWFGDGAPSLKRDRAMLYEQVARRLINVFFAQRHGTLQGLLPEPLQHARAHRGLRRLRPPHALPQKHKGCH